MKLIFKPQIDHINIGLHYLNCFPRTMCLQHLHLQLVVYLFFFKEHKELRKEVELPDIFLFELCHVFST